MHPSRLIIMKLCAKSGNFQFYGVLASIEVSSSLGIETRTKKEDWAKTGGVFLCLHL
jgi:hypothetical protein